MFGSRGDWHLGSDELGVRNSDFADFELADAHDDGKRSCRGDGVAHAARIRSASCAARQREHHCAPSNASNDYMPQESVRILLHSILPWKLLLPLQRMRDDTDEQRTIPPQTLHELARSTMYGVPQRLVEPGGCYLILAVQGEVRLLERWLQGRRVPS